MATHNPSAQNSHLHDYRYDHHGNPEGYARQGIIRRHIEAATSHNIIESNELQASATANEQSGFHSCRAAILQARADAVASQPIPRVDYTKTEQTLLDPTQDGTGPSRNYENWHGDRLHPDDQSNSMFTYKPPAGVRLDQALADKLVREESFMEHEYANRLIAPADDARRMTHIANALDTQQEPTKAAILRQRAQEAEDNSEKALPGNLDLMQVCAKRAATRCVPTGPNAQRAVERELEWASMVHSNDMLTGNPRGRFI